MARKAKKFTIRSRKDHLRQRHERLYLTRVELWMKLAARIAVRRWLSKNETKKGQEIMSRGMPIMDHPEMLPLPWRIIAAHEKQAQKNHYQSLLQLARRGGLGPDEAVAILEDRKWYKMDEVEAINRLSELVREATEQIGKRI